jgi:glycosyltransferase involved in cell wall biosynthesis
LIRLLAIIEATTITGPARNLLDFARLSPACGIETVTATFVRGEPDNLFTRTARAQGTTLETISETGAWDPAVAGKIASLVARLQPSIIQTHAVKSHFLLRRSGVHATHPWVAFHHGYTWPTLKARLYNQLDRWSLPAPRRILTVSQPFRDQLIAIGVDPARIEVIHNAIDHNWGHSDPAATDALRQSLGIPADRNIILIVGRLSREKDHLTLLEAVHKLEPRHRAHLVLVGDGPERPRIEARVRALNMSSQVTLAGQRDSAQPFYSLARIAVLSSLTEGSPNALLEAMAAGVPAIATRVGGVPEIATHEESALLVPPSSVAEMREALDRLLADPQLADALAHRSRHLIAERYTPQARTARLAAIYTELAGAPPHA